MKALLISLLLLMGCVSPKQETEAVNIYANFATKVVTVTSSPQNGSCTGFLYRGFIVTCYHAFSSTDFEPKVLTFDGKLHSTTIAYLSKNNDVVLLKFKEKNEFGEFTENQSYYTLEVGQPCYLIGTPLGLHYSLMPTAIASLNRILSSTSFPRDPINHGIQLSGIVFQGHSGSPVINSSGKLIGMLIQFVAPASESMGMGMAIAIEKIDAVINSSLSI